MLNTKDLAGKVYRRLTIAQAEVIKECRYFCRQQPGRILFHHVPKCGGSTLNNFLSKQYPGRVTFRVNGSRVGKSLDKFKVMSIDERYSYQLIYGHLTNHLIDYVHPDTLKVVLFREPISRIISFYHYVKRTEKHNLNSQLNEQGLKINDFIVSDLTNETSNWYTKLFSGMEYNEAANDLDLALDKALENIFTTYDLVGLTENFSSFTETLRSMANLPLAYDGQKKNVSENSTKTDQISQSIIDLITERNQADIALYKKIVEHIN